MIFFSTFQFVPGHGDQMSTGGDVDIEIDDVCDFGDVDCGEMEALVRVKSNIKS
jgi:hypothetical protein